MKISIVGCGGISRTHIGAVRDIPDARIISVADCIPERAEAAAKQCGAKAYTSLEDMLAGEKPDVLHICTPHYLHVPMAVYAMERGVDVLCEKPCAMTKTSSMSCANVSAGRGGSSESVFRTDITARCSISKISLIQKHTASLSA